MPYADQSETPYSPTGEIAWSDTATELSEEHEAGKIRVEPIDLIWVTVKPGCMG